MEHLLLGGGILLFLAVVLMGIALFAFWIWMLIDAITSPNLSDNEKILWVVVVFFAHFLGALIYFFVGRRSRAL